MSLLLRKRCFTLRGNKHLFPTIQSFAKVNYVFEKHNAKHVNLGMKGLMISVPSVVLSQTTAAFDILILLKGVNRDKNTCKYVWVLQLEMAPHTQNVYMYMCVCMYRHTYTRIFYIYDRCHSNTTTRHRKGSPWTAACTPISTRCSLSWVRFMVHKAWVAAIAKCTEDICWRSWLFMATVR